MWTLDELVERVREALAGEYPGAPNGRVRDVPDRRAIRWYTTIGLVDRPAGMRGRTALYGPRHLQQLVAIKRRQAEGQSLSQIQAEFTFLTPAGLTDASRVPGHLLDAGADGPGPDPDGPVRHHFWSDHPVAGPAEPVPAAAPASHATHTDAAPLHAAPVHTAPVHAAPVHAAPIHAAPIHGLVLGGGAILLLPHPAGDHDRADIAAAAAPLLDLLATRGLIDGRTP